MNRSFLPALAASLYLLSAVYAEDQLYRKGMGVERGVVSDMSKTEVSLSSGGVKRAFPANEIQRIVYDGEPGELSQARTVILTTANYKTALEDLKKVDVKKVESRADVVQQELDYYRAFCLANLSLTEGGDKAASEAALR